MATNAKAASLASLASFEDVLHAHEVKCTKALPFQRYTKGESRFLSIYKLHQNGVIKVVVGPKLYVAYGFTQELGRG